MVSLNQLFYGDNLSILRDYVADESVDLVYLDPPFNSNANCNILFRSPTGAAADGQIEAFEDTWRYGTEAANAYHEVIQSGRSDIAELLRSIQGFLGQNDMMAYLSMMAVRLIELHRVLKPTGSLYLHCDPTASHYLKLLLDGLFGPRNFRSEISWRRSLAHNDARQGRAQYGNIRDTILFYTKGNEWTWNWQYTAYDDSYADSAYRHIDPEGRRYRRGDLTAAKPGGDVSYGWPVKRPVGGGWEADIDAEFETPKDGWEYRQVPPYKGRFWAFSRANMTRFAREGRLVYASSGMPEYKRYLDEQLGAPLQNDWDDLPPVSGRERLGYLTQKPIALLERIVAALPNPGDVVLDPFCGCGTAVHAAQKLGRHWVGIDITYLSICLIQRRLMEAFPDVNFNIIGEPSGLDDARHLAAVEPYQFQYWITQKIGGQPYRGGRKGADRGIDGYIYYTRNAVGAGRAGTAAAIISVKTGRNVGVAMVRDLCGVLEREKADIGIFVSVAAPSRDMAREAAAAGIWTDPITNESYPRIQILTLDDVFAGRIPKLPLLDRQAGYRRAPREAGGRQQPSLF